MGTLTKHLCCHPTYSNHVPIGLAQVLVWIEVPTEPSVPYPDVKVFMYTEVEGGKGGEGKGGEGKGGEGKGGEGKEGRRRKEWMSCPSTIK